MDINPHWRTKREKITTKEVKSKSNLKKFLKTPIAYRSLKAIRTSPNYYENMKKDLLNNDLTTWSPEILCHHHKCQTYLEFFMQCIATNLKTTFTQDLRQFSRR